MVETRTKDIETIMSEIRKLVSDGKTVSITAKGYSMNPFIRHLEDQITLGPWEDHELRKGAAILARTTSGHYVFHRIVRREGKRLILSGDGNIKSTENATTDNVIAIMHSITRNDREYTSKGIVWKVYSFIWQILTPVRRYPLALWRKFNPQKPLHQA